MKWRPDESTEIQRNLGDFDGAISDQNKALDFDPSYADGYLNRASVRPGPVITNATINIADNAQFSINTSTLTILIQDPIDLDLIERIYFKPGRVVKLTVQYPETAILSEDDPSIGLAGNDLSRSELVTSTRILQNEFPPELVDEFLNWRVQI